MESSTTHKYDDIIEMPHHESATRPKMSNIDRAAQFAPFAALTGLDDAIDDTADKRKKSYDEDKFKLL